MAQIAALQTPTGDTKAMWWPNSINFALHRRLQSAKTHDMDTARPDSSCWGEMVDLMVAISNILFIFHLHVSVALLIERKTAKQATSSTKEG